MNEASLSVKQLRRVPVQERGRRTVERILDAAAERFVAAGFDATTTTEIAQRADVSVGSLYQFFPDKEGLLDALAARHIEGIDQILATVVQKLDADASLDDIVELIVDRIVAFSGKQPFFAVLVVGAGSPPVARASDRLRAELAARVELVIAHKPITAARRRVVASVCVDVLAALLPRALDEQGRKRTAMARELKLALVSYLAAVTPPE